LRPVSSPLSRRLKRLSLKGALLSLLVPTLLAVTALQLWMTHRDALDAANAAYDRSVLGAIESIGANVSTASGGLSVELPYRMFEFFQLTASGTVHFRVATPDGLVEIGSSDLPLPQRPVKVGETVFYDAVYFGEAVRVGYHERPLERPLPGSPAQHLIIQVAESTRSREQFTSKFVLQAALRDAAVLLLTIAAGTLVVTLAVRPVSVLAAQVRRRKVSDLTPLHAPNLPADIQPLVDAVNQQMQRTQNLVAQQRQFLDDASHQLRTPLATLRTQVDYAMRGLEEREMTEVLAAISQQIDQATRNANQLLVIARSDTAAIAVTDFDLADLVREVALALLPQARAKGIDFGIEVDENAPLPARGDRWLLREAIANLADNAIRYTPQGGEVTVKVAADPLGFGVTVLDNGPSVPPEELARLGQRFVRGRAGQGGGSGLGLAIARSIAARHGGSLEVGRAQADRGFRAAIWWPRAVPRAARASA
jgi:two-component system sensor histidine kinase TctE